MRLRCACCTPAGLDAVFRYAPEPFPTPRRGFLLQECQDGITEMIDHGISLRGQGKRHERSDALICLVQRSGKSDTATRKFSGWSIPERGGEQTTIAIGEVEESLDAWNRERCRPVTTGDSISPMQQLPRRRAWSGSNRSQARQQHVGIRHGSMIPAEPRLVGHGFRPAPAPWSVLARRRVALLLDECKASLKGATGALRKDSSRCRW